MDMDHSSELHQDMGSLENMMLGTKASNLQERKPRPQQEQALKCPRCESTNTKFCYYNNYSLSQPRYFCKSCRRYWTQGGTLRNVPVGGGCRKNRKSSSSSSSSTTSARRANDIVNSNSNQLIGASLSQLGYDSSDLSVAFARLQQQKQNGQLGFDIESHDLSVMGSHVLDHHSMISSSDPSSIHNSPAAPAFTDALRSGFLDNPSSNFHSLYYDYGNGSNSTPADIENSGGDQMNMRHNNPYCESDHMKDGFAKEDEGKALWGFPWQNINVGDGNNNAGSVGDGVFDSGRESWSYGLIGSSTNWHGLLNSAPLV